MVAGRMTTSTANIGAQSELHGHNLVCPGDNGNNVLFGNSLTTSTGSTGPYAIFGYQCSATGQGNVALGIGCDAGPTPATGFTDNVAVGRSCQAGNTAADGGNRVAMGSNCSASGGRNVALGRAVTLTNTNVANSDVLGVGGDITCGANALRNVLVGHNIRPNSRNNVLVFGDYVVGGYPAAGAGQVDNSILIGNSLQTIVKIGAYTITNGIAAVGFLGTANVTVANTVVETSLLGAGVGSLVIPAGRLSVGSTIRLRMRGVIADTALPTLQIRLKLNGTTYIDSGATALTALAGTHGWMYEADLTVRTAGAGGTAIGNGFCMVSTPTPPDLDSTNTGTIAIDTTAAQTLDVTAQWGTANVANTMTQTHVTMEIVG